MQSMIAFTHVQLYATACKAFKKAFLFVYNAESNNYIVGV